MTGGRTIASMFEGNGSSGPSFDMIRLSAALAVMVGHAFVVTGTRNHAFEVVSSGQVTLGGLAVGVFFVLSGYVITESLKRDPRPLAFLRKRLLRIYPALVAVVLATVFILGPAMTALPLGAYFADGRTALYLLNAVVPFNYHLPGVFTSNPIDTVNGSLWTLRYELLLYAVVALCAASILTRRSRVLAVACLCILLSGAGAMVQEHGGMVEHQFRELATTGSYFFSGAVMSLYAEEIAVNAATVGVAAALVAASLLLSGFYFVFPLAGAYLVAALGNSRLLDASHFRRGVLAGDFSYGVYIAAFPVEQAVRQWAGAAATWWSVLAISAPLVLALAMLSWHFIERPSLRLKYAGLRPTAKVI